MRRRQGAGARRTTQHMETSPATPPAQRRRSSALSKLRIRRSSSCSARTHSRASTPYSKHSARIWSRGKASPSAPASPPEANRSTQRLEEEERADGSAPAQPARAVKALSPERRHKDTL